MKKYAGEEFLNRLYKDLVHSEEVVHTAKGRNKNEDLAIYLERLERITKEARNKDRLDLLKRFYYKKYIIKEEEVPESYFENLEQMALERGYGYIKYDDNTKKEEINSIISEQKASLDSWLDYFISDDTNYYPMWFKYYVFQNVMKIGYFDKEKNEFTKRTSSTVKPFIEINREALAMLYDELSKYLNKQEISDTQLEQLIKNGSFVKIYSYIQKKLDEVKTTFITSNDGIWKKYEQGSDPQNLFNDIHGKKTGWCTAGGLETATSHLEGGDFHVYYTKDEQEEYTIPRIAIRMEYGKIAEIRGIAEQQNLENEMECVVEEKLNEFRDKDEYKKKVSDMKMLTIIYNKYINNEELTKEELRFLYEIDSKIIGFGYKIDPRIKEIKNERNLKKDLAIIFSVTEEEVSLSQKEFLEGNKKVHYADLDLSDTYIVDNLVLPKYVNGTLDLSSLTSAEGLVLPEEINGILNMRNLTTCKGIVWPKKMNCDLWLDKLTNGEGLILPKIVNGDIRLFCLKNAKGVVFPEILNGLLELRELKSAEDLVLPKEINGDLWFSSLSNAEGLVLPEILNGNLWFVSLIQVESLKLPEKIGGNLCFVWLNSTKGIIFPKEISGELYLQSLKIAKDIIFPSKIGRDLCIPHVTKAKNVVFPEEIGGKLLVEDLICIEDTNLPNSVMDDINFYMLEKLKNVTFPKKVKKYISLRRLIEAKGLVFPEELDGSLLLEKITTAQGITFPKIITGSLVLINLYDAKGLVLPELIEGELFLNSLTDAEGIVLPKNEQGEFYVPGKKLQCQLTEEQLIEAAKRTEARQQEPKIFEEIDDLSTGNPKK